MPLVGELPGGGRGWGLNWFPVEVAGSAHTPDGEDRGRNINSPLLGGVEGGASAVHVDSCLRIRPGLGTGRTWA